MVALNDPKLFAQSLHERVEAAIREVLEQSGSGRGDADVYRAARSVVLDILYEWGGEQIYLPVRSKFLHEAVREEIESGARASDVARKYRMAKSSVYKILQSQRGMVDAGHGRQN